jgi:hypothetical protein
MTTTKRRSNKPMKHFKTKAGMIAVLVDVEYVQFFFVLQPTFYQYFEYVPMLMWDDDTRSVLLKKTNWYNEHIDAYIQRVVDGEKILLSILNKKK